MAWCGVEEPLQRNCGLYALREEDGETVCAEFVESKLCRYSFTKLESTETAGIVAQVLPQLGHEASWIYIWKNDSPDSSQLRREISLSQLRASGFGTSFLGEIGIGIRAREENMDVSMIQDSFAFHRKCRGVLFLVSGPGKALDFIRLDKALPTLRNAARMRALGPSREFSACLAESKMGLLYTEKSISGHTCIVVVSPRKIDLESLVSKQVINRVESGDKASIVWQT
jgi:hypothetical protein